jgi:hypothetical protein
MSVLNDSRVEAFIGAPDSNDTYTAFELNAAARALDFRATFPRRFQYEFSTSYAAHVSETLKDDWPLAELWGHSGAETQSANLAWLHQAKLFLLSVPWSDLYVGGKASTSSASASDSGDATRSTDFVPPAALRIGLYRGDPLGSGSSAWWYWQSAVDPHSPDVNFHVPQTFATAQLQMHRGATANERKN